MRISDWSSDACSSDLNLRRSVALAPIIFLIAAAASTSPRSVYTSRAVWRSALASGFPIQAKKDFRSEEHTSELQSLMHISYAVICLKKKNIHQSISAHNNTPQL